MKTRSYEFKIELPLSRQIVWELLSDTDHLNRFIGLFPVQFSMPDILEGTFYRWAEARAFGLIPIKWKEFPFEWEQEKSYAVERQYEAGPIKRFYGGIKINQGSYSNRTDTTEVTLFADFTPRNSLGLLAIPLMGKRSMKLTVRYLKELAETASYKESELNFVPIRSNHSKVNDIQLHNRTQALKKFPVDLKIAGFLETHLRNHYDDRVLNMRPYEWADRWGVDRYETLRVFLYATKAGLTELSWHLMCPNCRVSKAATTNLKDLKEQVHCDFCGINYEMNFDQYVEIRFSVHPVIRRAYEQTYCVSGPQVTPHIKRQMLIHPGEEVVFQRPSASDSSLQRIRVLQKNWVYDPQFKGNKLLITKSGFEPGHLAEQLEKEIWIKNQLSEDIILVSEELAWSSQLTTAREVTSLQEFRTLFSSEVLSPGTQIKVGYLTFLFSDLKGSTALYEIKGDAEAYSQVRHHFELLTEEILLNKGAVVKTIGDAVMAVFHEPSNGLRAAYDILQTIKTFNQNNGYSLILKLGLHSGPAIAVNSNDRLDYFGRTVNMAARIQGLSHGEDLVLSQEVMNDPNVKQALEQMDSNTETYQTALKGIKEEVVVTRLILN